MYPNVKLNRYNKKRIFTYVLIGLFAFKVFLKYAVLSFMYLRYKGKKESQK